MIVGENSHLDVTRVIEIPLDVHGRVGEIHLPFPPRRLVGTLDLLGRVGDPQPLSPPPAEALIATEIRSRLLQRGRQPRSSPARSCPG